MPKAYAVVAYNRGEADVEVGIIAKDFGDAHALAQTLLAGKYERIAVSMTPSYKGTNIINK